MPHIDGLPDDDGAGPDQAGRILHYKKARASAQMRDLRKPSNWWAIECEPWKRVGAELRAAEKAGTDRDRADRALRSAFAFAVTALGRRKMAVIDELERRVRTVEEVASGEKHLTRYAVEQTQRNGEMLHALRTDVSAATMRLDRLMGDMAAVKAALATHSRALDALQQDVRQLRGEVRELRAGRDEINRKLDAIIASSDKFPVIIIPDNIRLPSRSAGAKPRRHDVIGGATSGCSQMPGRRRRI